MKKTELEKSKALKLMGQMQKAVIPGRFAQGSTALPDRREQRKLDQAAGLVPFAVKLHQDLVRQLNEQAAKDGVSLHELTARVIKAGLGAPVAASAPVAAAPVVAKKAAAKKASGDTAEAPKPAAQQAVAKTAAKPSAAKTVPKAATKKAAAKAS